MYIIINSEDLKVRCKGKKDEILPSIGRIGAYQVNVLCNCIVSGTKD